ncbi:MAG: glucuronyl hydrolase, partial [Chitinophagaceae bacterium]
MTRFICSLFLLCWVSVLQAQRPNVKKAFNHAEKQTEFLLAATEKADKGKSGDLVSPKTVEEGGLVLTNSSNWVSGFFPGVLWYLYEYTKDAVWLEAAKKHTGFLEKEKYNSRTHDLGFMIYCSYGNGFRLTQDTIYSDVIVQAAKSLSTRFNPITGVIRSWDHSRDKWEYPVIIDNMMNLELLFAATKLTGDSSFYKIAVTHADNTLKNHFRPDYSSFHVVDYDSRTGAVRNRHTHQGYSHESSWARGQAWALYGYILCYRETGNKTYLANAEGIANYVLNNPAIPKDGVPYWDYHDPKIPDAPKDASAAAITASALYELNIYTG